MDRFLRPLAPLVLIAGVCWVLFPTRIVVLRPRLGVPAILRPGEELAIELASSVPFHLPALEVGLRGRAGAHVLVAETVQRGGARHVLSARLPEDLPVGAYDLELTWSGGIDGRTRSVHVVDRLPQRWTLVQIADLPTFSGDGTGEAAMRSLVDEINVIAPDLVLVTGDVAYQHSWDAYDRLYREIERLDAPVVVAVGNHELKGFAPFQALFGPMYHVVDFDHVRVVSLNTAHGRDQLSQSQFAWLREALAGREGRTAIVQLHHPVFGDKRVRGMRAELVAELGTHEVPIVLSGHMHGDKVFDEEGNDRADTWDFPGTKYVTTTAAGAELRQHFSTSPVHHGYRVVRMEGGKVLTYTYDYDDDGELDATSSHPIEGIQVRATGARQVTVSNRLNEMLPAARIRIEVPGAAIELVPSVGRLVERFQDGATTVHVVELDLLGESETVIRLEERT